MVRIVTGKINSGKTTRLESIYKKEEIGDGFISIKRMIGTDVYGFFAKRLSDNYTLLFMLHNRYYQDNDIFIESDTTYDYAYEIGPYKVLTNALKMISETYTELLNNTTNPLYFDEVGKLELDDLGFAPFIKQALEKGLDIYMTIREDLIPIVIKKFNILEYEIISR